MSVHLVGGGWTPVGDPAITATFLAEASVRAAGSGRMVPRIGVLIAVTGDTPSPEFRDGYPASLRAVAACEPIVTIVEAGDTFAPRVLTDIDALVVGGGVTPAYLAADRKSTRLNSSHVKISYAVFCLKKKKMINTKI